MKHARSRLSLMLAGVLSAGVFFHASASEPSKTKEPSPDYLSDTTRALLRKKMGRHGVDARELMYGVTLLRYDVARAAAQRIASEPRIARPEPGSEDDLSAALPERFFLLQDEARMRAQAVRDSAERRDDKVMAENYGLLVQTCVNCHSLYGKRQ
ncbi:MAG TPA: hypothetical protein VF794_13840 [Archangium sp.]|jgi:hypothetical protein|uniref:hypothetical protein n=1 Tax=Archangium sp. TaxID=1872627 RepID=UPI002ED7BE2F